MEEKGFWRTIRGRRVFIVDGESPLDAYKKSIENASNNLINKDKTINKKVALEGANPDRDKHVGKQRGNCSSCVPTYMERLRGNDVIANPQDEKVQSNWYKLYKGVDSYKDWTYVEGRNSGLRQITKDIKEAGDGAVFEVYIKYNRAYGGDTAHVFSARNDGGKVIFENPQDYRISKGESRVDYFKEKSMWGYTMWLRIDDKELKDEYKDRIYRKAN